MSYVALLSFAFALGSDHSQQYPELSFFFRFAWLGFLFNKYLLLALLFVGFVLTSRAIFPTARLMSGLVQLFLTLLAWTLGATELLALIGLTSTTAGPFINYFGALFQGIVLFLGLINAALLAMPEVVTAEGS